MEVPIEASRVCGQCGKVVRRDAVVYAAGAGLLCALCFTKADVTAARRRRGFEGTAVALVGAIAAVVPFVAHAVSSQMAAANRHDWVALASGIFAAVCGGSTIAAAREHASGGWLTAGALAVALGVYHIARGAGLVG
ncbi:MAG TPA: hypothetical protein VHT91_13370 [Kofleriaceae bacterium]|jgi:hypothetical protein|nr:hypothetical protein [Kofleriaceae bacterium]